MAVMNSDYLNKSNFYTSNESLEKIDIPMRELIGSQVPLVEHKNDGFELNSHAFDEMLKQKDLLKKKLIVVSIFGEYRKGKSFFLNYIIRYLRNYEKENWIEEDVDLMWFNSKEGLNRVTDGIVMWSHAFPFKDEYAVVLIDTEGTHDEVAKMNKMSQVFSCCALNSSVLIYNVNKAIDKQTMDELQCFSEFARNDRNISQFGKLMLLVRDWRYVSVLDFGLQSGNQHLEHWMKTDIDGASDTIRKCFTDIECFLMPKPGGKIRKNEVEGDAGKNATMDEKFMQNLKVVIEHIFNPANLKVHIRNKKELRLEKISKMFTENIESVINSDVIVKSMGQVKKEEIFSAALKKSVTKYKDEMEVKLNESQLNAFQFISYEYTVYVQALGAFDKATQHQGNSMYCTYRTQLIQELRYCKVQYNNYHNILQKKYKELRKKDKKIKELKEERKKLMSSTPNLTVINNVTNNTNEASTSNCPTDLNKYSVKGLSNKSVSMSNLTECGGKNNTTGVYKQLFSSESMETMKNDKSMKNEEKQSIEALPTEENIQTENSTDDESVKSEEIHSIGDGNTNTEESINSINYESVKNEEKESIEDGNTKENIQTENSTDDESVKSEEIHSIGDGNTNTEESINSINYESVKNEEKESIVDGNTKENIQTENSTDDESVKSEEIHSIGDGNTNTEESINSIDDKSVKNEEKESIVDGNTKPKENTQMEDLTADKNMLDEENECIANSEDSKYSKENYDIDQLNVKIEFIHSMYEEQRKEIQKNDKISEDMKQKEINMSIQDEKDAINKMKYELDEKMSYVRQIIKKGKKGFNYLTSLFFSNEKF